MDKFKIETLAIEICRSRISCIITECEDLKFWYKYITIFEILITHFND